MSKRVSGPFAEGLTHLGGEEPYEPDRDAASKAQVAAVPSCYIPRCPNTGNIPASITKDILWPDGSLLGSYRTNVMLCESHTERLVKERSIDA